MSRVHMCELCDPCRQWEFEKRRNKMNREVNLLILSMELLEKSNLTMEEFEKNRSPAAFVNLMLNHEEQLIFEALLEMKNDELMAICRFVDTQSHSFRQFGLNNLENSFIEDTFKVTSARFLEIGNYDIFQIHRAALVIALAMYELSETAWYLKATTIQR
nr:hypothetical protein [bacterium]